MTLREVLEMFPETTELVLNYGVCIIKYINEEIPEQVLGEKVRSISVSPIQKNKLWVKMEE